MSSIQLDLETFCDAELRLAHDALLEQCLEHVASSADPDLRVHDIRKNLKKERALLRLVEPPSELTRELGRRHRATGRILSEIRDAAAAVETLTRHEGPLAQATSPQTVHDLRARLESSHHLMLEPVRFDLRMAGVERGIRDALRVASDIRFDGHGFDALRKGLKRWYSKGRKIVRRLEGPDADPELFHTVRKRTKDHRYQLEFLAGDNAPISDLAQSLHELTDELGAAQDLHVLSGLLEHDRDDQVRKVLQRLAIEHRVAALQLARTAFARKPGEMARSIHATLSPMEKEQ